MEPFLFQSGAADRIAGRFQEYAANPLMIDRHSALPFLQTLVSITGSGKTLVLAETVSRLQAGMPTQPVVLWISKGKIVVSQTYANLSAGKYADNLSGFVVNPRNTGYFLPLLDLASSATYWPDFLVWIDNRVVVIDTKGDHLLQEATASKLFEIDTADGTPAKVILRLVSEGQSQLTTQGALARLSPRGLTVWRWRNGKPNSIHCEDEREAVRLALDLS